MAKSGTVADSINAAFKPLTDLRAKIAEAEAKREALKNAPLDRDESIENAKAWLSRKAQIGAQVVADCARQLQNPGANVELTEFSMNDGRQLAQLETLVVFLNREALEKAITSEINEQADPSRLPRASIRDDLVKLGAEIHGLCVREEVLVREIEAAGIPVNRRADADPAIVLADDPAKIAA